MEGVKLESLSSNKGLNFLPKLAMANGFQPQLRFHRLRPSFYGNYEGDSTMFPASPSNMFEEAYDSLDDMDNLNYGMENNTMEYEKDEALTHEEKTFKSETTTTTLETEEKPPTVTTATEKYIKNILSHKYLQQALTFIEILSNQKVCKCFIESAQVVYATIVWALLLVCRQIFQKTKLNDISYLMACMRNFNRQILWWMTLSKSGDILHFGRMVIATPLVFLIASIGLIVAICKGLQYNIKGVKTGLQAFILWFRQLEYKNTKSERM